MLFSYNGFVIVMSIFCSWIS